MFSRSLKRTGAACMFLLLTGPAAHARLGLSLGAEVTSSFEGVPALVGVLEYSTATRWFGEARFAAAASQYPLPFFPDMRSCSVKLCYSFLCFKGGGCFASVAPVAERWSHLVGHPEDELLDLGLSAVAGVRWQTPKLPIRVQLEGGLAYMPITLVGNWIGGLDRGFQGRSNPPSYPWMHPALRLFIGVPLLR